MARTSAALCLWRRTDDGLELLVVHPGGPYWANKDEGAWSLPKGEFDADHEDGREAARREFREELGHDAPAGALLELGSTKLKSGKRVEAWAIEGDLDADAIVSNTFELEWPPRSGTMKTVPEIDRARWCTPEVARHKLNPAQGVFVDRLVAALEP